MTAFGHQPVYTAQPIQNLGQMNDYSTSSVSSLSEVPLSGTLWKIVTKVLYHLKIFGPIQRTQSSAMGFLNQNTPLQRLQGRNNPMQDTMQAPFPNGRSHMSQMHQGMEFIPAGGSLTSIPHCPMARQLHLRPPFWATMWLSS